MAEDLRTCDNCDGQCCKYVAVELERPDNKASFEEMIYYLHHEKVRICVAIAGVRRRTWYLEFQGRCRYLDVDGRCEIYAHRSKICRDHSVEECEYHEEKSFRNLDTVPDLLDFMREIGRAKWADNLESKLPARCLT